MRAGDTVAGRFVLEREAGVGGMGRVYRAQDTQSGQPVALKILLARDPTSQERFEREARILSELSHPAIVGYVAHGKDASGRLFLAMQWLDGLPLNQRLRKGPLELADAIKLGEHMADALAAAHEAGVMHRDIKPSNLILADGQDSVVRLVDFGVARRAEEALKVTRTGMIIGSCAYMSPEQALAQRDVDARSDLFSLGCVLYECVTGVRAFGARDATAALAKVLLDEPRAVQELTPNAPVALSDLISWLLRKERTERPATARAVCEALHTISERLASGDAQPVVLAPAAPVIGTRERRVVWVVLASGVGDQSDDDVPTQVETAPTLPGASSGTAQLRSIVKSFGGALAFLADGAGIATFTGGVPTDEAPRAARCALSLREALPSSPIAIAMGPGVVGERAPIGDVIDAAAETLRQTPPGAIRLYGIDPDWLPSFEVRKDAYGLLLGGRKGETLTPRTLLGKPTVCVGRDRELAMLEGLFDDCVNEPQARAALLSAPAGGGKSRVRYELLARLAQRDDPPLILLGRCDVMSAGAAFAPLGDAIRRHAGIGPSDDAEQRRRKLESCVSSAAADPLTLTAFLAELCDMPFPDSASETLRAARRDARMMGDMLRASFEEWVSLAMRKRPVMMVLEDLHWGDVPSVRLLDGVLRNLAAQPFFVLALARPEIETSFPNLWAERGLVTVALAPMSRRAAEQLVTATLGDKLAPEEIASLAQRAQGNALFLEELIRGAAEGAKELPDSILGIIQARFDALSPDARRVLRAASVFGESFSEDDVAALVGGDLAGPGLPEELDVLARAELVTASADGEYRFRHALVRDAAYAMLTDDDKRSAHAVAGELLETRGGEDALALAEHFVRGGAPARAIAHFRRAASKALQGNHLRGAIAIAERALALAPPSLDEGVLHAIIAEGSRWIGEYDRAAEHGQRAMDILPEGTVEWFFAVGEYIAACAYRHDYENAVRPIALARAVQGATPEARNARIVCVSRGGTQLVEGARYAEADDVIAELLQTPTDEFDDFTRGWVSWLLAMRSLGAGDLAAFVHHTEASVASFESVGEVRNICSQRTNLAYAYAELGAYERAETMLRRNYLDAERLGLPMIRAYALQNLGNVLRGVGRLDDAMRELEHAVTISESIGDARIEGASRASLALVALELGDVARAEGLAERAAALHEKNPPLLSLAKIVLARVRLAQNRPTEACELATYALSILEEGAEDGETLIRLTHVEALLRANRNAEARIAAAAAEKRLLERAARVHDDALRTSFLTRVVESVRTLELAKTLAE